jgi:hypothetical protein
LNHVKKAPFLIDEELCDGAPPPYQNRSLPNLDRQQLWIWRTNIIEKSNSSTINKLLKTKIPTSKLEGAVIENDFSFQDMLITLPFWKRGNNMLWRTIFSYLYKCRRPFRRMQGRGHLFLENILRTPSRIGH